jgi:hypothetical protein
MTREMASEERERGREGGRKAATCNLFDEQDDGTMGDHVCMDR